MKTFISTFDRWTQTVKYIEDYGFTPYFVLGDAFIAVFAVGILTIVSSAVEFLIGTPNWPEMVIAFLLIYWMCFIWYMKSWRVTLMIFDEIDEDGLFERMEEDGII